MKYTALEAHFGRIQRLDDAMGMLQWDLAAMMPRGGAEARTEQMATLSVMRHEMATDARIGDWLAGSEGADLTDWQAANRHRIHRGYVHATAVPAELVEALTRATAICEQTWRTARAADDFATLRPKLEAVVSLTREAASAKSEALGVTPYQALLDEYDPGMTVERIDGLFSDLAAWLPGTIDRVLDAQERRPKLIRPKGPFPAAAQKAVGVALMGALGFDFTHGRLDVSHHPFCGGTPDDVRITTRYDEDDFTTALMGVLHETGHALYERGLPTEWRYQPVGRAASMSAHESQSLLMEMQACRTRAFIEFAAPILRTHFAPEGGPAWTVDNLHRLYTRVERGLIRVDADEVTYPAHVILRYRLEKQLLAGAVEVADLPEAWRAAMVELVGIAPEDDADGCMQDIHWIDGAFGYFPTSTLGAMAAAQLFAAARDGIDDVEGHIARGDFAPLVGWLRENVHRWGSRFTTDELLTRATGAPLSVDAFKAHIQRRYLKEEG